MNTKTQKINFTIRDICFIAIFTAIIAVCAQISIPMPTGVPFTLQTFAIPLAGIVLGTKKGTLSVIIYVLLGIIGVPIFSGFGGGFAYVSGKTGGFILSFPLMTLCVGIFSYIGSNKKTVVKYFFIAVGLVLGACLNYICGILMFSAITSSSIKDAFIWCVLPFLLTDSIKLILAGVMGVTVKKILTKSKILI